LEVVVGKKETAPQTSFYIHVMESKSDYEKFLSMSASAKAKYGFAKASGKASFRENTRINSYELNVIVQALVKLPPLQIEEYSLNDLFSTYVYNKPELINDKYGLSYINEVIFGGECLIIFNLKSKNEEHYKQMSASLKAKAGPMSGKAKFSQAMTEVSQESFSTITVIQNGTKMPDISLESVVDFALAYPSSINETNSVLLEYSSLNLKSIPEIEDVDYNSLFDLDFKNEQKSKLNYANLLYENILVWEDDATYVVNNSTQFDESILQQASNHLKEIVIKKEQIINYIDNCRNLENNDYLDKIEQCSYQAFTYKRKVITSTTVPDTTPTIVTKPKPRRDNTDNRPGGFPR
jgi:hypothetical protein